MPTGKPKAGYRKRKNADGELGLPKKYTGEGYAKRRFRRLHVAGAKTPVNTMPEVTNMNETPAQIRSRINGRFKVMERMVEQAIKGKLAALIVSGPPGVSKSYTVEDKLRKWDPLEKKHVVIKGFVRATGVFTELYKYRHKGCVVVFDDADSIFWDETSLNMLKGCVDTLQKRRVSWLTQKDFWSEEEARIIPKTFEFKGTVIFITNHDFDHEIEKKTRLAPHMAALMSRAHYIDMMMKSRRDIVVRIEQMMTKVLKSQDLDDKQSADVRKFFRTHVAELRELSLRTIIKIASIRKEQGSNWKNVAKVTCCKN